ncbi:unnamed protein product [Ectocarpus sp. 6 AP-2014]
MKTFLRNPGGKQLSRNEAVGSNLASEHIFCGPERPVGNRRRANMHGVLARSNPHYGYDGIRPPGSKGTTVHVNDVAIVALQEDGTGATNNNSVCRVLEVFWDAEKKKMVASVRPFKPAIDVAQDETDGGGAILTAYGVQFMRVWEPQGTDKSITEEVGTADIKDLCEIYPEADVKARQDRIPDWKEGERVCDIQPLACVGVAFVTPAKKRGGNRKRNAPGGAASSTSPPYQRSEPWTLEGTLDEPLYTIRGDGYFHNVSNRPFVSVPVNYHIDGFNAHGLGNKKSVGGTYLSWAWNTLALQRRKLEIHVATVASPGASCEGEMLLQCKILHELEKGCIARAFVQDRNGRWKEVEVFVRGGVLLIVADSPQRALILYCKHPNASTLHPCPYCLVGQFGDDGGELGSPKYDIESNRRTRGQILRGRRTLAELAPTPAAQATASKELGVAVPVPEQPIWPLHDIVKIDALKATPVESLHADALNVQSLVQSFILTRLIPAGRKLVSAIIREHGHALYPRREAPLKDIVTNYSSLTGSNKWLLSSIMLLVFRPVLQSSWSMAKYFKQDFMKTLVSEWRGQNAAWEGMLTLVQSASALSFAVRAPSHNDEELKQLHTHALDMVHTAKQVIGRDGVRPSMHSTLHYSDAVNNHDEFVGFLLLHGGVTVTSACTGERPSK